MKIKIITFLLCTTIVPIYSMEKVGESEKIPAIILSLKKYEKEQTLQRLATAIQRYKTIAKVKVDSVDKNVYNLHGLLKANKIVAQNPDIPGYLIAPYPEQFVCTACNKYQSPSYVAMKDHANCMHNISIRSSRDFLEKIIQINNALIAIATAQETSML